MLYTNCLKYISQYVLLVLFKENLLLSHELLWGGVESVLIPLLHTLLGFPRPGLNLAKTDARVG